MITKFTKDGGGMKSKLVGYEIIKNEGGEVTNIIVTEEQAKEIEYALKYTAGKIAFDHIYDNTDGLELATIARIVEGEPFRTNREFKVGDVIECSYIYKIISGGMLPTFGNGVNVVGIEYVKFNTEIFTLVCKAENREDLAHE